MTPDIARATTDANANRPGAPALTLADLQRLLDEPWQTEILLRASVPVRFDRDIIENVFCEGLTGTPELSEIYEWLEHHDDVEFNEAPVETFSIRQALRRNLLAREREKLQSAPEVSALRTLAGKLATRFAARDSEWQLDAISVLIIADPARAWQHLARLYRVAERKADLTRCYQLLQVAEERGGLLDALSRSPSEWAEPYRIFLTKMREQRRLYDATRNFAADFERTSQVLERKVMRDAWNWVSRKPRKAAALTNSSIEQARATPKARDEWILNVEAKGGSGKTIFLRWLAARKCIRSGIPYARLDFDFVDPRLTKVAPWYLLAQCARTLNPQLENRPLAGVIERADDFVPYDVFSLGAQEVSKALSRLSGSVASEYGPAAIEEMARALERSSAKIVVIVLDTLEVAMLNQEADMLAMLRQLQTLHDRCPKVRVILSGRFGPASRIPEFEKEFGAQTRTLKLEHLSLAESRAYLVRTRGMPRGAVVDEIAKRCDGLPFGLSLFADEWQINRSLSVRDVRKFEGPELLYLVERVLKRVPSQIAWLLRYGVAARRLNKAFVADVIIPELEEFKQSSQYDNPLLDSKVVAQYYDSAKLTLGEQVLSPDLLWADLERHASLFSFVSRDATQPNCLVIHPDVLEPLRREMQKHPVVQRLHQRAMEQSTTRAGVLNATNVAVWTAERTEAFYHALRLRDVDAIASWKTADDQMKMIGAIEPCTVIAVEALDPAVTINADFRLLAARTRAEAFVQLALFKFDGSAGEWESANRALVEWSGWLRALRKPRSAAFQIASVRIASKAGVPAKAGLKALQAALRNTRNSREKLELHSALVSGNAGRPAALRHIKAATAILARKNHGWDLSETQNFRLMACGEYSRQGDFTGALQAIQAVTANMTGMPVATQMTAHAWELYLLSTCEMVSAVPRVVQCALELDAQIVQNGVLAIPEAWTARIQLRNEAMRAYTAGAPLPPPALVVNTPMPEWDVQEKCIDAMMMKLNMRPGEAMQLFQQARSEAGNQVAFAARALTSSMMVSHSLLFDLRQSAEILREASSLALDEGSSEWLEVHFRTCLLNPEGAAKSLQRLRGAVKKMPSVNLEALLAIAAMATAKRSSLQQSLALVKAIKKITPIVARRRLFFELTFNVRHLQLHVNARKKLASALELPTKVRATAQPKAIANLLQQWMAHQWVAPENVSSLPPYKVRNSLDLAKWYCDTEGLGRFSGHLESMLTDSDLSDFARGIVKLALAGQARDAGNVTSAIRYLKRSRELLSASTVPLSIWLARATLMLCQLDTKAADAQTLLLSAQDMCERLNARPDLELATALLSATTNANRIDEVPQIDAVGISPQSIARLTRAKSGIVKAVAKDVERSVTRRTPENVVGAMAERFFACIDDLAGIVTGDELLSVDTPRFALVASHPTIAALPLEVVVGAEVALLDRKSNSVTKVVTGWRSVDTPHTSVNERWVLRVLNALGVSASDGTQTLEATTRAFQDSIGLPSTGVPDSATLRGMVRALRKDRNTAVAVIIAMSPQWSVGANLLVSRIYDKAASTVDLLMEGSAAAIRTLQANQYDVIHIIAPLVESGSYGGLAFNLRPAYAQTHAPSAESGSNQYLAITDFTNAIKRTESLLRPVVIVHNVLEDLPIEESMRQFCLRNIVALELARTGAPVATVAISTSLNTSDDTTASVLARTLVAGEPLSHFLDAVGSRSAPYNAKRAGSRGSSVADQAVVRELEANASCVYATNPEYVIV